MMLKGITTILLLAFLGIGLFVLIGKAKNRPAPLPVVVSRTSLYQCEGNYQFVIHQENGSLQLYLPEKTITLHRAKTASGRQYNNPQENTALWLKSGEARLTAAGMVRSCRDRPTLWDEASTTEDADFYASGNEPGWYATVSADTIEVVTDYGESRHIYPKPEAIPSETGHIISYEIEDDDNLFSLILENTPCRDSMSGLPYATTVRIQMNESNFTGCGKLLERSP